MQTGSKARTRRSLPSSRPLLVAVIVGSFASCSTSNESATMTPDLILTNASVWTANPDHPRAQAISIKDDRILDVGTADEIESTAGPETRTVDLEGQFVAPGFIDAHVHFLVGGFRLSGVQLRDAATPEEFANRIAAFAKTIPAGSWITGGDWDHERWGGELPHRSWIDELTPDHPVWVNRLDGHMALANSLALELADVSGTTDQVAGGTIVVNAGQPTGILKDNAMGLVESVVTDPGPELEDRALDRAMAYVASKGVTSVHHVGTWG